MEIVARRHAARCRDMRLVGGAGRQRILRDERELLSASRRDESGSRVRIHLTQLFERADQRGLLPPHAESRDLRKPRPRPVDIRKARRGALRRTVQ
ncbi:hypothetical protein [Paraburkholderia sabiae]|uniref:hypothetical protein n=1 Tax=Paraburkholderia sabiae TaxID=273251 RepID=UPI00319D88CF